MMNDGLRVLSLPGKAFRGGNPYFRLFCEGLEGCGVETVEVKSTAALLGRFDIVHLHFPEHYITEQTLLNAFRWGGFYLLLLVRSKLFRQTIVRSVHNVHPFKERHLWLLRPYMAIIRALVDANVFMSASSERAFLTAFPSASRKPRLHIRHSTYTVSESDQEAVAIERAQLSNDGQAFVVGFLGNIKAYKNVSALRLLPPSLSDGRPIRVLIAGPADREAAPEVEAVVNDLGPDRTIRRDRRLSDDDLDLLIRCVDVVFLPYTRGWNSGLATLVLCNRGRVIGSDLPVFSDMIDEYGSPWIYQYSTASELDNVLNVASRSDPTQADRARLSVLLDRSSVPSVSSDLKIFYEELRARNT